jgi:hypothetical protein
VHLALLESLECEEVQICEEVEDFVLVDKTFYSVIGNDFITIKKYRQRLFSLSANYQCPQGHKFGNKKMRIRKYHVTFRKWKIYANESYWPLG